MKNAIYGGFRQAANILFFLVPVLTAAVIMMNFIDPVIRTYRENGFFVQGFHIEILTEGFQSDALTSFLPILAVLPFSGCFVDDLKSKFARFFLIRSSYRTYIISRIIVGFLAGGLAILSGALIAWGTTAAVLIPIEQEIEGMEPAAIDGLIEICFLLFVNGGFWSVVGMAMSTLMESKYISYATPFVLYYLLVILYLLEDTNIFQIDKIAAGGETTLTLRFGTDASIPAGKYTLSFTFNYDSSKTLNLSSSGTAIVEIQQPANMELVMPRFPQSVTVGETIPLSLQVMNMGRDKMYNVRCVVSGYGFAPTNTGYIGAMDAGSSATTEVELYIIALNASKGNESGSQYGATTGTITLIYEDESGEEFSQEVQFETSVNRPIVEIPQTDTAAEEEEKATNQWWISVVILGGVICAAGIGIFLIRQYRKNRSGKYL